MEAAILQYCCSAVFLQWMLQYCNTAAALSLPAVEAAILQYCCSAKSSCSGCCNTAAALSHCAVQRPVHCGLYSQTMCFRGCWKISVPPTRTVYHSAYHSQTEVADHNCSLTQFPYSDTGPTSHIILTPGRPVPVLTLYRQAPGRVATGVPIFKLLV